MRTPTYSTLSLFALISLIGLSGCFVRPTHLVQRPQPVVVQQRPIVVQQQPVVVQQPAPVVVHQPAPVVVRSPVMTPVRVSVPARPVNSVSTGIINYPHQRVRYPLNLSHHRQIHFYIDGHGLDPTLAVYNASGRRVAFNDDGGSGLDSQLTLSLQPGSYIVEIAGYGSSTGSFTMTVN